MDLIDKVLDRTTKQRLANEKKMGPAAAFCTSHFMQKGLDGKHNAFPERARWQRCTENSYYVS